MNEVLFFTQILLIFCFVLGAKKLGREALVAWVAIQAIVANLFVLKQIVLFGFHVTASDAFAIGSLLGLNFIQEYFGRDDARKATWTCFFFMFFFVLVSQLHLLYEPSTYDTTQGAFQTILSPAPRLLMASMGVFFVVQQIDIRFFAFIKNRFPQANFALRSTVALIFSQLIDTFLFSFAGLYGMVASIVDIILVSFLIKSIVICSYAFFARWAKI